LRGWPIVQRGAVIVAKRAAIQAAAARSVTPATASLLPLVLMLLGNWADVFFAPKTFRNDLLPLGGNSVTGLLIGALVRFCTFGKYAASSARRPPR
jgi:GntP family gluconate:H+ symporter